MPIRFRCAYCNQLMGIARRKAGTIVRCPKCAGQVVVPTPPVEEEGPDQPQALSGNPGAGEAGLFDATDFEKIFSQGVAAGSPQMQQPPIMFNPLGNNPRALASHPGMSEYDAPPLRSFRTSSRGVHLTAAALVGVAALVTVLMGLAFFLGFLLGKSAAP